VTRRILAALLGLTLALLFGVVVPLGVTTAEHDRQAFADQTTAAATAVASAAEEQLADHENGAPAPGILAYRPLSSATTSSQSTTVADTFSFTAPHNYELPRRRLQQLCPARP